MATVSIIIPVYNVSKYIDKCLNSLVSQTFSDIEIIVVNDGSTDASGEKCLEWAGRDNRIIYVSKRNEGAGPSRNLGIQMASSEFVAFCDPDDWYDERYVELMLEKQRETDADVVVCGYHMFDGVRGEIESTYHPERIDNCAQPWTWQLWAALWNKLYKRVLFIENRIKMPACISQDRAVHYYLMTIAKKVTLLEQPLYYYLFNRAGSSASSTERITSSTVSYLTNSWDLFIRDGIFEDYKKPLLVNALEVISAWYIRIENNPEYAEKWLFGCIAAVKKYFGDMAGIIDTNLCVVGSYSLYSGIVPRIFNDSEIENTYCFSGLISYMCDIETNSPIIANPFRQKALSLDFQKVLRKNISSGKFDYIVIDFLDERFDIAHFDGGYYTKSDAFLDGDISFSYDTHNRLDKDIISLWQKECIKFVELLKASFALDRIILVKNFLSEKYGTYENLTDFDGVYNIRRINRMIGECYNFFVSMLPGVHIVDINDSGLCYTSEHFRHGREPWHYNYTYYLEIRSRIVEILLREF